MSYNARPDGPKKLFIDANDKELNKIIEKIVNLRGEGGKLLIEKYDIKWLISEFEGDKINFIETRFKKYGKQGLDIVDFCTAMLEEISHQEHETLYILIGLVDIFRNITESYNLNNRIQVQELTALFADVTHHHP